MIDTKAKDLSDPSRIANALERIADALEQRGTKDGSANQSIPQKLIAEIKQMNERSRHVAS